MSKAAAQEHTSDVMDKLYQDALRAKNTDFVIQVGNVTINCHSSVVCVESPFFDSIKSTGIKKVDLNEYNLTKDGALVQDIIRYMYLGVIDLSDDTVVTVARAADFLKYPKLSATCEDFMLSTLSPGTYRAYSAAATNFQLDLLAAACKVFPKRNFSALAATSWFLATLVLTELMQYLADDELGVTSEDEVLAAVVSWMCLCNDSEEEKRRHLDSLINLVRLTFCSASKIESILKNKTTPAVIKVKLYEFREDGRKVEIARNTYAKNPELAKPSSSGVATIVVVGGREAGNSKSDQILYLNDRYENEKVAHAHELDMDFYHVHFADKFFIVSGGLSVSKETSVSSIHQYSTDTGTWTALPDMKQARGRHVSAILNQLLYVIGGCFETPGKDDKYVQEVEVLDLETKEWGAAAKFPYGVHHHAAAVVQGKILVTGGGDIGGKWSNKTVLYDKSLDNWTQRASIPQSRASAYNSTVTLGSRVYVLARWDFLVYDAALDEWTTLAPPPVPSYWCPMFLHNDTLLVMGGSEDSYDTKNPLDLVQRYDPRTHTWIVENHSMATPLSDHYACVMQLPATAPVTRSKEKCSIS